MPPFLLEVNMYKLTIVRATSEEVAKIRENKLVDRKWVSEDAVFGDYVSLRALLKKVTEIMEEEEIIRRAYEFSEKYDFEDDPEDTLEFCDKRIVEELFGNLSEVTGSFVLNGDADYEEIWLTSSSRPYDRDAEFMRVL